MADAPLFVKTEFVADLIAETAVTTSFLVQRKDVRQKQNGEAYLSLTLSDRTGQVDANMWDRVAEVQNEFQRDDFVRVRAQVTLYREKLQLKVEKLRKLSEEEVNLGDYLPVTSGDVEAMFAELLQRIAAVRNPHLQALLNAVFTDQDIATRFKRAPAAKALHHAYLGGLLEHVLSLCRLGEMATKNYGFVDADLLTTGILLHDIGKIEELGYERSFRYTTRGQLLGHIVMALELIHKKLAGLPDFPPQLQALVEHLVISHHGQYEFGSPKLPMFPEAMLLHELDEMDSKMQAMDSQLRQEAVNGEWTEKNRSLERSLLRVSDWLAEKSEEGTLGGTPDAAAAADSPETLETRAARLKASLRGERR